MATTFKVRENKNLTGRNADENRFEVAMYEGREFSAVCGYSSAIKAEAVERAAEMQADYDLGISRGYSAREAYAFAHSGATPA